jgi:hypothetical protein
MVSRQALCYRDHMDRERERANSTAAERRLICERCGREFGCGRDDIGACWCNAEAYRLPLPTAGGGRAADCLCPDCLRRAAQPKPPSASAGQG